MDRRPSSFTGPYTLLPYTTLFRSGLHGSLHGVDGLVVGPEIVIQPALALGRVDGLVARHRGAVALGADQSGITGGTIAVDQQPGPAGQHRRRIQQGGQDRKSTRLNSSH